MGPSAIRYAGLAEHLAETLNITTNDLGNVEAPVAESLAIDDHTARFLPQILALCDRVAKRPRIAAYLASPRRIPFSQWGIWRYYKPLDA